MPDIDHHPCPQGFVFSENLCHPNPFIFENSVEVQSPDF